MRLASLPGEDDDPTLAPLRVLIGSPDVTTSDLLSKTLNGRGYEVEVVRTEAGVLERIDSENFDVVILAWALPGASGLQTLRQVRSRYAMPDLPVVLMSSQHDSGSVVQAFDRGANEFLALPLDPDVTLVRIHNLVALRRARLALRQQAMVDALTGVFNRRYMMEQLSNQLSQAQRYGRRLSFCLCDIDHFKSVNDNFGHQMGDQALRFFARTLRQRLRRADIIGRFGGDELCVVFPETSVVNARIAIDAVRRLIAKTPITANGTSCLITGSFGLAEFGHDVSNAHALVSLADEALYAAKEGGRNRSCIVTSQAPPESGVSMCPMAATG